VNALSGARPFSPAESVAIANTSGLAKYLPGKVWGFALQAHLLSAHGVPPALPLFVNLVNLYVSLATSAFLGLLCLLLAQAGASAPRLLPLLLAVVLGDLCFLAFHARLFRSAAALYGRIRGCEIARYELPGRVLAGLYLAHGSAAVFSGAGAYWACVGTGFDPGEGKALLVASSAVLADVVGFLALFVPGGLGVREGVMFLLLRDGAGGPLALILPLATRFVNLAADAALGGIAFALLGRFRRASGTADAARGPERSPGGRT
jgi:hypothetical protein